MTGRPRIYSEEMADAICDRLAEGESLNAICAKPGFVSSTTVAKWVQENTDGFAAKYAQARGRGLQYIADDIIRISDEEPDPARAKVRVDARKWVLSKLRPEVYGDKLDLKHGGAVEVRSISDDELKLGLADIIRKATPILTFGRDRASESDEEDSDALP